MAFPRIGLAQDATPAASALDDASQHRLDAGAALGRQGQDQIRQLDEVGREFAAALAERARAGVRVRLIYDWLGSFGKASRSFWRSLADAGVEVRRFNPPRISRPFAWLHRDHRKMLVIESVERLLERPTRDGFSDLMTLAQSDEGLGILMTCRDYSVEQVQASFLYAAGIDHAVIEVPPLDDTELQEIQDAFSSLTVPLANPALREILRHYGRLAAE